MERMRKGLERQVRQGLECSHKHLHLILHIKVALMNHLFFFFFFNQRNGRFKALTEEC